MSIAFALSLAGGILIVLGGATMSWFASVPHFLGGMGSMMGMHVAMMGGLNFGRLMVGVSMLGLASGIIVLAGAALLSSQPQKQKALGTIILTFSALSLLGMGGFLVGATLGMIGGALALADPLRQGAIVPSVG